MEVQEKISRKRLKRKIGKTLKVLVDAVDKDGALARSAADAPEIDGQVIIPDGRKLKPGDWATVKIERADAHDLWDDSLHKLEHEHGIPKTGQKRH